MRREGKKEGRPEVYGAGRKTMQGALVRRERDLQALVGV